MRIETWKNLADLFLKEDKRVYVKDANGDYYFGKILFVGDKTLEIECFAPDTRAGKKFVLYWIQVIRFDEYREEI